MMKLNVKAKDDDKVEKKAVSKPAKSEAKKVSAPKAEKVEKPKKEEKVEKEAVAEERKTEVKKELPKIEAKKLRKEGEYSAKDISVLKGLEPVRLRPGMYIGGTGLDGLHHLIWEVVNNCLDEAIAGYAKNVEVVLLPENRVRISEDGRGIPV
jgi:hypothetical protein